jgi:hypothetical protein
MGLVTDPAVLREVAEAQQAGTGDAAMEACIDAVAGTPHPNLGVGHPGTTLEAFRFLTCEHMLVASKVPPTLASVVPLDQRDALGASAAALKLHHVGLADALDLTLLYLDSEPARYKRAALRWHERFAHDARLALDDSLGALGLLAAFRGRRAQEAAHALASLVGTNRTLLPIAEVLGRWAALRQVSAQRQAGNVATPAP